MISCRLGLSIRLKNTGELILTLSKNRILKILIALLIAVCAWVTMYYRPWFPGFEITIDQPAVISLEKSNGEIVETSLNPQTQNKFAFFSLKFLSLQDKNSKPIKVEPHYYQGQSETLRRDPQVLEAISIVSVLFFLFLWMTLENFSPHWLDKNHLLMILLNASVLILILLCSFPGYFGYDSFDNYRAFASFAGSPFIGDVYFSIFTVFYQFFPEAWIVTSFNLLVIFLCLNSLAFMAIRWEQKKIYLLAMALFFLFPTNFFISAYSVRDISASWIFTYLLIDLYDLLISKEFTFPRQLKLFFVLLLACVLRQEALYIVIPALMAISFFLYRSFLRPMSFILVATIGLITLTKIVDYNPRQYDIYKTTLYINPLSYILKKQYPESLPSHVHQRLGTFFKNDYLLTQQSDYEISPFHQGGLNYGFTVQERDQFRQAAWEIFLDHPGLWIENRWVLGQYILGFKKDFNYTLSDEFFNAKQFNPYFFRVKQETGLKAAARFSWAQNFSHRVISFSYKYSFLANSYLFALIIFIISATYSRRSPLFWAISGILIIRTLLVMAIAPAGYFKYIYPLWIFVAFVLPLLFAEHRLRLTKSGLPFKTL